MLAIEIAYPRKKWGVRRGPKPRAVIWTKPVKNKERQRIRQAEYRRENRHAINVATAARKAAKLQAVPPWAHLGRIAETYREAIQLSAASGTPMHVDHIVPLKSKLVCGLHCMDNLRIIPAFDNMVKNNKQWPDMWGNVTPLSEVFRGPGILQPHGPVQHSPDEARPLESGSGSQTQE